MIVLVLPVHVEVAYLPALLRPYPAAGDQERFTSYNLVTVYTIMNYFREPHYRSGLSNHTSLDFFLKVRANGTIFTFYQDNIFTQSSRRRKHNRREPSAFVRIKYQALFAHRSILQMLEVGSAWKEDWDARCYLFFSHMINHCLREGHTCSKSNIPCDYIYFLINDCHYEYVYTSAAAVDIAFFADNNIMII